LLGLAVGKPQLQALDAAKCRTEPGPSCALIKKKKNFLIYKKIQKGAVRSHGLLKYDKLFAHFLIY
jgi:hypothetical protein